MAYSKVMASSSPPNPDLPAQTSSPALHSAANLRSDYSRGFGSMNMEDILNNIYSDSDSFAPENNSGEAIKNGSKTVDEVWRDIVRGSAGAGEPAMTLEVFLAKAGVVNEEDVGVSEGVKMAPAPAPPPQTDMMSSATGVPAVQFAPIVCVQNGMGAGGFGVELGNGVAAVGCGGGGRGKRRAPVEEAPLDKATQQKQRRMIKNRESAARSRERKQAYTVELEAQVTKLEDENAVLLKEEVPLFFN
ncbi:ABSCISIC ACID-INSENSITIVE 5-like protein 5 [Dorcoceras hygrometricum]|uniref:ABSCISIC ACID-INSENSITIVE 5-like protein 5 n=1 Tax=Dorcoceras hygrometricum TaxID=472368 RepID=A0A2Z7C433_9LAMI|nr:ABSCISIC ACID-INSENSITIVE 5-like protein 5 [Dorcoceras hygrometricum]